MQSLSIAGLRRNIFLNLIGYGLPLVAAVIAVPILLQALGPERFGVVALAWTLVALIGVLDLGFGRAMTRAVAEQIGKGEEGRIGSLVGTAAGITAVLGLVLAGLLFRLAPVVVFRVLEIPAWLQEEAVASVRILAFAVPAVLVGNCLRGVLEARQLFGRLTLLRTVFGTALLLGPVVALRVAPTLIPIMWVFVGIRWAALAAFLVLARQAASERWSFNFREIPQLARVGGWMTVSAVLASLMLYADRFAIGALLSIAAVAYYAAPFEVINRLSVIPAAVMGVIFPAYSQLIGSGGAGLNTVYRRSLGFIAAMLAPPVIVIAVFSRPLLALWLGPEAAAQSAGVASILAVGMLIHGLIQPSFHLLQAAGRPDVPAVFQLVETPLYFVYLIALTLRFGIEGTATAWLIRVAVSLLAQTWLAHRFVLADINRHEVTV